ncbi:Ribokinase-like protein [Lentinus tigrinus ALCF2SS1-7]|uniref:Ribokinase-like protein n=1 Tax=Lentinus tigrinus ALCF2SS1-6 TaxID=1328759 RepID=A0A5C2SDL4_9APHY|nr:Ribokinase-like protein [Lentinus tigrinus ALCF2SS1-6]RPD74370.1 Ribokinase-like protein [Lentinus tigrinus ALCF2SS1-7]
MASKDVSDKHRAFVSLGMFIVDEFSFADEDGNPTGKTMAPQIGGGGTYASIGARIWLPSSQVGMIIDRGHDFPAHIQDALNVYGADMWQFRDDPNRGTTRALNAYKGEHRGFEYLTPRLRITPHDLLDTKLSHARVLHFICSPTRAAAIMSEVKRVEKWHPTTVYEPIPDRCVPEELPALRSVLPEISVLSPNAEEALSLLSMPANPTKESIESACSAFLDMGIGPKGDGAVVIRSGAMGACIGLKGNPCSWVEAFWNGEDSADKVVDVTGAGNSFLGGLGAGMVLSNGDVREATLYATVSASYTIEQEGLPRLSQATDDNGEVVEVWNGDSAHHRLQALRVCLAAKGTK